MQTILWHLPISPYSEKVRWALDLKGIEHQRRAAMPGPHIALALALTRGRSFTFPVLDIEGKRIGDSTAIIAELERRVPEPALYPQDPAERRHALALEDYFDEQVGVHVRRLVFRELQRDGDHFQRLAASLAPAPLNRLPRVANVYGRAYSGARFLVASKRASERSRAAVLASLDRLESELGGRDYLVGDRFTVADLSAAALLYPLALPPEGPRLLSQSAAFTELREPLVGRPALQWALEMYRRHRRPASAKLERESSPQLA
jgi:glutathione S-transferase